MIRTDVSGKWVSIDQVMKLLELIAELESKVYGGKTY
jgi:hypothetical protein